MGIRQAEIVINGLTSSHLLRYTFHMHKYLFILVTISLLFVGCATDDFKGKTEAERLFNEALTLIDDERYILATEKLNIIKTEHPYSFYATPAELLLAEILFKQENYIEAAAAFLLFRDFHPKHEKIAHIVYMIGESYYKQLPDTIDRDLESGFEALKYYQELIDKYPQDVKAKKAQKRITRIKKLLLDKDQYIADFYFKTEVWKAARYWYLDIVEKNPENSALRDHSLPRVVVATAQLKEWEACLIYAEKFVDIVSEEKRSQLSDWKKICQNQKIP